MMKNSLGCIDDETEKKEKRLKNVSEYETAAGGVCREETGVVNNHHQHANVSQLCRHSSLFSTIFIILDNQ